ncbi:MAG: PQQ-binding-like beta-propeller repeat protein, partial [Verrucomicrobiota bacterium]
SAYFSFRFVLRFAVLVLAVPSASSAASAPITGKVFLDENRNGRADPTEPGVPAVVSDGRRVVKTSEAGEYRIEVEEGAPFVFVTLPRGYRGADSFYAKPNGRNAIDFALIPWPESRADEVRFVQISDVHVGAPGADDKTFRDDIREINGLLPKAAFVVATGDLVNRGEQAPQLENYRNGMKEFAPLLFNLPGNHDVAAAKGLEHYHLYLGPDYYSFNVGSCHFLLLNSSRKDEIQQAWIKQDLATAPAGATLIVGMHHLPTPRQLEEFAQMGAKAVISGHWHGNRVQSVHGMFDLNTPPLRFGGIDRHPRSFRVIEVKNGNVTNELRLGGFDRHAVFAAPAGAVLPGATSLAVVVNCYDSKVDVAAVECAWGSRTFALTRTGTWSWAGNVDVPTGAEGAHSMRATIRAADGFMWEAKTNFHLTKGLSAARTAAFDLKWVAPTGGFMGFSSPCVGQELVAVGLDDKGDLQHCGVVAFDRSGKRRWFFNTDSGIKNTIAAANGRIFATSVAGWLYALDEASGKLLWKVELDRKRERWEIAATTASNGLVHVGSYSYVAAFDEKTGQRVWETRNGTALGDWDPRSYTVPFFAKDKVLLSHHRWGLYVLKAATGERAWHLEGRFSGCVVNDDIVYILRDGSFTALALENGRVLWTAAEKIKGSASRPVWAQGRIVIGTGDGRICALSPQDGRLLWSYQTGPSLTTLQPYERGASDVNSTPAVADDFLYVGSSDGELHAVALADGAKIASYRLGAPTASSPCIADGVLYIGGYDGNLYAFALRQRGDGAGKQAR